MKMPRGLSVFTAAILLSNCSVFATRPTQEMSDNAAALRAAREVQADTLAPELYRQATEWWLKAKREYKFKNFLEARQYSEKSRRLAEQAEFEAIRSGGNRTSDAIPDQKEVQAPPAPEPPSEPNPYPTSSDQMGQDQRTLENAQKSNGSPQQSVEPPAPATPQPTTTPTPPFPTQRQSGVPMLQ
jgi:hypothetical protein